MTGDNNLLATTEAAYVACGSAEAARKVIDVVRAPRGLAFFSP
jgi:hypothetical protein